MAGRLVAAGHEVVGFNRTKSKAEEFARKFEAKTASSVADAVRQSELAITMLSDDASVEAVVSEPNGILQALPKGGIHLSMSTISPTLSRKLSRLHANQGQKYVSSPVLGRPEAAEQGKLFILTSGLASGDTELVSRLKPVFEAMGQKVFEMGTDPGAANLTKLSCNFLIAAVIEALSEAFALIRKAECIDPEVYLNLLTGTLFSGGVFQVYGKNVLEHHFKPGFKVPLGLKDIELGIAAGKEASVPLPLASLIRDHFVSAIAQGWGDLDWSALALVALRAAGMKAGSHSRLVSTDTSSPSAQTT